MLAFLYDALKLLKAAFKTYFSAYQSEFLKKLLNYGFKLGLLKVKISLLGWFNLV